MPELKDLAKTPEAVKQWPPLTKLLEIGLFAAHSGRVAQARTLFQGLLQASPDLVPARLGMAVTQIVTNEFDQAEAGLDSVLAGRPGDPEALALKGLCLGLAGRLEEAGKILTEIEGAAGPAAEMARALRSML